LLTLGIVNQDGNTPLQLALERGHTAVVEMLSKVGAAKDAEGEVRERRVQGE
jgi:ankyrin repeat protein